MRYVFNNYFLKTPCFSQFNILQRCQKFFLFEPICTAVLLAICSMVHVIRIHAIYDKNKKILAGMSSLLAVQIVVTAICCGFFRSE